MYGLKAMLKITFTLRVKGKARGEVGFCVQSQG